MGLTKNEQTVYNFLAGKGLSADAIYGVMANIKAESNFSTTAKNYQSGAYGLFQWKGSRKTALQEYTKERGTNESDIQTQLDFFWHELETSESKTKAVLTSRYDTAEEYAELFESTFERSGGSNLTARKMYASKYATELRDSGSREFSTGEGRATKELESKELTWWGDIVKVVIILFLIIGGVIFIALSIGGKMHTPTEMLLNSVKGGTDNK